MRISDWSSDVCSSDLADLATGAAVAPRLLHSACEQLLQQFDGRLYRVLRGAAEPRRPRDGPGGTRCPQPSRAPHCPDEGRDTVEPAIDRKSDGADKRW